ncbi:MAG: glutathione synthase/RimK-type ligase-like ATP-grasp enzyme [Glaciecola sp.]|uniref:RimK family protein n=1 Tax=Congregibacter sp. TaxID=2744308 RepID=UPI0039E5A6C5
MLQTLIVVDDDTSSLDDFFSDVISFTVYLRDYPKKNEPRARIINLCDTEHYLSRGYYCSLLAEARRHRAMPALKTVNELRSGVWKNDDFPLLESDYKGVHESVVNEDHFAFFGQSTTPALQKLASRLFRHYPAPILRFTLLREEGRYALKVARAGYADLHGEQHARFVEAMKAFIGKDWRKTVPSANLRWDMAILVNPQEALPPSDKAAIGRFIRAASALGIRAEAVTAAELENIANYDALFIREGTAIDHHTYRLSLRAEKAGLVVMDDPTSILRCCNKVFLHDAFDYQGVPSLQTEVVMDSSAETLDRLEELFTYPVVIKTPEGSFSTGVFKAESRLALQQRLESLLRETALVLVQEYLYTEYDWRVGVLNGKPLYSCRYYMARDHWQIYNHSAQKVVDGRWDTLPTFETPKAVLDAACAAAAVVGDGLYGVDIKQKDNIAFVIEVNDNPSIEHDVEDGYLGDELYRQIMAEFLRRLEARGR